jgi:hypothetical protein
LYKFIDFGSWLVTLSERHKLRVSENGVLRDIFGVEGVETTGD